MPTLTATYSFQVPVTGGDVNDWGTYLNANWTALDGLLGGTTPIAPNLVGWSVGGTLVTATAAELNILDGVTATTAELNLLDGVTATTAELNILDGVTATAAELNILDGATLTVTELNYVDGVTSAIQTQLDAKAPLASPALTGTPTAPTAAYGTDTTQVATMAALVDRDMQGGTIVATTSGTAFDFTGIPAEVQEIEVLFDGVSLSGTDNVLVQLGTSGGLVTAGYVSNSAYVVNSSGTSGASSTTGFVVLLGNSSQNLSGILKFRRALGTNSWAACHACAGVIRSIIGGGFVALAGELISVRITRTGSNEFDAGQLNVRWK